MSLYYQDEYVTLYHGDCLTDHREWLDAVVLVTDPPYGIEWAQRKGRQGASSGDRGTYRKVSKSIANDSSTKARDDALCAWGSKPAVVFGTWKTARPEGVNNRLIWDKRGANPGPLNAAFYSTEEEIYIIGKGFRKSSPPQRSVIHTTEQRSQEVKDIGHPTPKPIGLMELLIDRCPDGSIADPFAGAGATLIASKNLNRRAVGVEINEKYCEMAAKRLSQGLLMLEWTA